MHHHRFNTLALLAQSLLLALAPLGASAQVVAPLNCRGTFLRTSNDSPQLPAVVALGSITGPGGIAVLPGDRLLFEALGEYTYQASPSTLARSLVGVFSSSGTLLGEGLQFRVPGAIASDGPPLLSGSTYFNSLPMDIPQDFLISTLDIDSTSAAIPAGAAVVFLGVHDSLYNDNTDVDGDLGVRISFLCRPAVITAQPAPLARCTGEAAAFSVGTSGGIGAAAYQWRLDGVAIDPAVNPSAATASLTLSAAAALPGRYDVVVTTNGSCAVTSQTARLYLNAADLGRAGGLPGPDGALDNNDFIVFIDYFFAGDPRADLGRTGGVLGEDGQYDNNDFIVFIDRFFSGC